MNTEINSKIEQNGPYIPAVVGFLMRGNEVLFITRKASHTNLGAGKMSGVGGKVEKGESAQQAFVRETEEEIGVTVDLAGLESRGRVYWARDYAPEKNMYADVFVCTDWSGEPHETDEGAVIPSWHPISELPINRSFGDYVLWAEEVIEGSSVLAFLEFNEEGEYLTKEVMFY